MKKLQRLQYIERVHGPEFVNPYRVCYTQDDISQAYWDLWGMYGRRTTGIRTDWIKGDEQGYQLPFGWNLDRQQAQEFMSLHGPKLMYLVAVGGQVVAAVNGVAIRLDKSHALFEINAKEPGIAQRHMYCTPENLERFVLGSGGHYLWNNTFYRSYDPVAMWRWSFDVVYRQMFLHDEEELTFSVRQHDRSIVLW